MLDTSTSDPKKYSREDLSARSDDNPDAFPNINLSSKSSQLSPINRR